MANRILHKSTDAKFYTFGEKDKDLAHKLRENVVGGPSIIFTRYAEVGKTMIRNSSNICKTVVGVDASQLYPYAMTQQMPSGGYTRWDWDENHGCFIFKKDGKSELKKKVMDYIQCCNPECTY